MTHIAQQMLSSAKNQLAPEQWIAKIAQEHISDLEPLTFNMTTTDQQTLIPTTRSNHRNI